MKDGVKGEESTHFREEIRTSWTIVKHTTTSAVLFRDTEVCQRSSSTENEYARLKGGISSRQGKSATMLSTANKVGMHLTIS